MKQFHFWFVLLKKKKHEVIYTKLYTPKSIVFGFKFIFSCFHNWNIYFKFKYSILKSHIFYHSCYCRSCRPVFSLLITVTHYFFIKSVIPEVNNLTRILFDKFSLSFILCNHLENTNNQSIPKTSIVWLFKLPFFHFLKPLPLVAT